MNFPDSAACRTALEVATEFQTPSLLNHSIRAYLWAADHAGRHGIAFDAELLFVSAMLHDIGLAAAFDNVSVPFEDAGGHVAWVFGAGAGWPVERRRRAAEVIVRHMWDVVDVTEDPEGHLLELSTAMDISGRQTDEIPAEVRREVLAAYPRLDLVTEFAACFVAQGERKPGSLAARFVKAGLDGKLAANPLNS
ncbi:HD domain-containing protein [Nonomuraea soli]|uniref:HD superfamily phosphodiesterase n=1 Tax=Nonomuraea soli TaxID=1032476 RepID=A0A7W0CMR0_9ACTN|nr:HD domain-containing protein [Nonomuraea soli]MBA2894034.1 HD superfamily phosphodiesterase [Nonomuraea soli]